MMNPKWNISQHGRPSSPQKMAEPVHRIPPGGTTTGASLRTVPKSCIQQVKEICLHYVGKCSGQYIDNKAAARYVHQMADEIILQLSGVANEIKRTKGEPEMYQALIDEWNEHFPPSLGAMGSPKAIANIVNLQNREISRLKEELQSERTNRENDVSSILRSMDAQLHAYRTSVMNDKRQQRFNFEEELAEKDRKIKELQSFHEEEKKQLKNQYADSLRDLKMKYDNLLQAAKVRNEESEQAHKKQLNALYNKVKVNMELFQEKNAQLRDRNNELREKYNNLATILHQDLDTTSTDSDSDDEELLSLSDLDLQLQHPEDEQGEDVNDEDSVREALQRRKEEKMKRKQEKQAAKSERKVQRQQLAAQRKKQTVHMDETQIKELRESHIASLIKIRELEADNEMLRSQVEGLKKELEKVLVKLAELTKERESHINHLRQFEIINETMRQALYRNLGTEYTAEELETKAVQGKTQLLCHTPHFLDYPDRNGPKHKHKKISAYNQPGHF